MRHAIRKNSQRRHRISKTLMAKQQQNGTRAPEDTTREQYVVERGVGKGRVTQQRRSESEKDKSPQVESTTTSTTPGKLGREEKKRGNPRTSSRKDRISKGLDKSVRKGQGTRNSQEVRMEW